jgi:hypothetical protein
MTVRQLIPPGFVLGLVVTGVAALLWKPAIVLFALVAGSYTAIVLGAGVQTALKQGPATGLALAAVLPAIHISYGAGFWRRVIELLLPFRARVAEGAAELPLSR